MKIIFLTILATMGSEGFANETISAADRDKAVANLNAVLTEARCVPEFEKGKPVGYRCFQITPGSVYDKIGLQDNDVICGVDGEPVTDPAKAFERLSKLKDPATKNVKICIKRNGVETTKSYDFVETKPGPPPAPKKSKKKVLAKTKQVKQ